jgi:hypothetical protein
MTNSLYNIETEYLELISVIESMDGEITEDVNELLIINESQLKAKSIGYNKVITNKEAINTAIDIEIKRLQTLKNRNNKLIGRLKESLLNAVKMFGTIETQFNKFGTRKSSSVVVEDVNKLPKEYKVIKVEEKADKKKIKEALKNGLEIKGCSISDNLSLKID